ncbi:MAG: hypothetical protein ABI557_13840 [Aureliella sp.]
MKPASERILRREFHAKSAEEANPVALGDVCAGCSELSARVERLEIAMESLRGVVPAQQLRTTACYWITLGVHCFFFWILSAGIEMLAMHLYAALSGAVGSLAACHVLPIRPVTHKFLRSVLSVALVGTAVMLPLMVAADLELVAVLPLLLIYVAPCFAAAWFAAKLFVWLGGWRIVPPGHSNNWPPMKIRDYFVVTLIAALYFGACRAMLSGNNVELSDPQSMYILAAIACAGLICASVATLMARGLLMHPPAIGWRWLFAASGVLIAVFFCLTGYSALQSEGLEGMSQWVVYSAFCLTYVLMCMLSPLTTFLLMRSAGYRLQVGRRTFGS